MSALQEERARVEQKAAIAEQVLTLSAVNQSGSTINPVLVSSMVEEAAKLHKEIEDLVSTDHKYAKRCTYHSHAGQINFKLTDKG